MNCSYHTQRAAEHTCVHCGRPLCSTCYDPQQGECSGGCPDPAKPLDPTRKSRSPWVQALVAILAIIGALTVLLLSICAGIVFTN